MGALHFKTATFTQEVLESEVPVLVDFWASWCGPCQMQGPIIEELADEASGVKIGKVDVDAEPDIAAQFGIMSIPTIVVIKNGKISAKAVGVQSKEQLKEMLAK